MKKIVLLFIILLSSTISYAFDYVVTDNLEVLNYPVYFVQDNVHTQVLERARDEQGLFIANDPLTAINEAYELATVNKTIQEFTYINIVDNLLYIQITGGYNGTCFNSLKYPVTEEIYIWFSSLGSTLNISEYIDIIREKQKDEISI